MNFERRRFSRQIWRPRFERWQCGLKWVTDWFVARLPWNRKLHDRRRRRGSCRLAKRFQKFSDTILVCFFRFGCERTRSL